MYNINWIIVVVDECTRWKMKIFMNFFFLSFLMARIREQIFYEIFEVERLQNELDTGYHTWYEWSQFSLLSLFADLKIWIFACKFVYSINDVKYELRTIHLHWTMVLLYIHWSLQLDRLYIHSSWMWNFMMVLFRFIYMNLYEKWLTYAHIVCWSLLRNQMR